jgi:hypothetical protein
MPLTEKKLAELAELTVEMLGAARAGDWESVAALEEQRQAVIAAKCRGPLADPATARRRLEEMSVRNAAILKAVMAARELARSELEGLAKGSRAVAAYAQHAG